MEFQMGPLQSIFQIGVIFTIILNKGLFIPFYPQLGEFGWSDLDSTIQHYCMVEMDSYTLQ